MGGGPGAKDRGIERFPRTASAEHEENGIHTDTVGSGRLAAAKGMGVHAGRNQPLDLRPQVIGDAPGFGTFQLLLVHSCRLYRNARCIKPKCSCMQLL